jgi:hypothetical protein
MHIFAAAGASFPLAVLWFDLMLDVQTPKAAGGPLSPEVAGLDLTRAPGAADTCRHVQRRAAI